MTFEEWTRRLNEEIQEELEGGNVKDEDKADKLNQLYFKPEKEEITDREYLMRLFKDSLED